MQFEKYGNVRATVYIVCVQRVPRDLEWHKTGCWAHRNVIERFIVREGTNATVPLTIVVRTIAQEYKWLLHNFERINQVANVKENAHIKECSLMCNLRNGFRSQSIIFI